MDMVIVARTTPEPRGDLDVNVLECTSTTGVWETRTVQWTCR